jgi:small subunit ribosomal protein S6
MTADQLDNQTSQYEVAVVYHPDLEIDLEKATSRVEKIFTDNGGKVTNADNWGKRKLAYPIKRLEYGVYIFYTVDFPAANVRKVEGLLNITDEVIRFLITKPDLNKIAKADALRAEKAKKAEARKAAGAPDDKDDRDDKSEKES